MAHLIFPPEKPDGELLLATVSYPEHCISLESMDRLD
jgi:hypothetical protein